MNDGIDIEKIRKIMYIIKRGSNMSVQILKDNAGHNIGVFVSIEDYKKMMEQIEELNDIKDFDSRSKDPEWILMENVKKDLGV